MTSEYVQHPVNPTISVNVVLACGDVQKHLARHTDIRLLDGIHLLSQPHFWELRDHAFRLWIRLVFKHLLLERAPSLGNPLAIVRKESLNGYLAGRDLLKLNARCRNARDLLFQLCEDEADLYVTGHNWIGDVRDSHLFSAEAMLRSIPEARFIAMMSRNGDSSNSESAIQLSMRHASEAVIGRLQQNFPDRVLILNPASSNIEPAISEFLALRPEFIADQLQPSATPAPSDDRSTCDPPLALQFLQRQKRALANPGPWQLCRAGWDLLSFARKKIFRSPILPKKAKQRPAKLAVAQQVIAGADSSKIRKDIDQALAEYFPADKSHVPCETAIAIAFTGRHGILKLICELLNAYKGDIALQIVLIGSNEEDAAFGHSLTTELPIAHFFHFANEPLGAKWQFAVECARRFNPETLVILGSDDLASPAFFRRIREIILHEKVGDRPTTGLYGFNDWFMWNCDPSSEHANTLWHISYNHLQSGYTLGAGRIYTKRFLEKIHWKLFETTWRCWLDNLGEEKLQDVGWEREILSGTPVISIKGSWCAMNAATSILYAEQLTVIPFDFQSRSALEELFPGINEKLNLMKEGNQ